jgi:RNA polymerase sigma-70 factor (ECF subfamily)
MSLHRDSVVKVLLRERLRVMTVASAIVRDVHAADDIYQQVVLAALQVEGGFQDEGHVLAWALRTAKHRSLDLARRRQLLSLPDDMLDQLEAEWSDPASTKWTDQAEALQRCLGRLGEHSRAVLRMRYADGMTANAIAGKLHRSADAVYQMLSRIHRALRNCVQHELELQSRRTHGSVS